MNRCWRVGWIQIPGACSTCMEIRLWNIPVYSTEDAFCNENAAKNGLAETLHFLVDTGGKLCQNHTIHWKRTQQSLRRSAWKATLMARQIMEVKFMEANLIEGTVSKLTEGPYVRGGVIDERQFIPHRPADEQRRGISRGSYAGGAGPFMAAGSPLSWAE